MLNKILIIIENAGAVQLLKTDIHLLCIAFFGGLVLFGLKLAEHWNRPNEDKMSLKPYILFHGFLFLTLPILGSAVTAIYIVNGDKISSILSFQIGLTSPAIVQSMVIAAADSARQKPILTIDKNQ